MLENADNSTFRKIPSVASILESLDVTSNGLSRSVITGIVRRVLDNARKDLANGKNLSLELILQECQSQISRKSTSTLVNAINATGVVLHTGLGRASLSVRAQQAVAVVASGNSVVEYDLEDGSRGDRQEHVRWKLCEISGAESALVVNNNAGATLLAVAGLAAGKDVVISRGELVEIGGSFRIPDIIELSGARLVEVGAHDELMARNGQYSELYRIQANAYR